MFSDINIQQHKQKIFIKNMSVLDEKTVRISRPKTHPNHKSKEWKDNKGHKCKRELLRWTLFRCPEDVSYLSFGSISQIRINRLWRRAGSLFGRFRQI